MPRPKGYKLSPEQKARMQAGRKAKKEKASEGMIPGQEKLKKEKPKEIEIIGYGMDKGDSIPYPIFSSEKNTFIGKLYQTCHEAKEAWK